MGHQLTYCIKLRQFESQTHALHVQTVHWGQADCLLPLSRNTKYVHITMKLLNAKHINQYAYIQSVC